MYLPTPKIALYIVPKIFRIIQRCGSKIRNISEFQPFFLCKGINPLWNQPMIRIMQVRITESRLYMMSNIPKHQFFQLPYYNSNKNL